MRTMLEQWEFHAAKSKATYPYLSDLAADCIDLFNERNSINAKLDAEMATSAALRDENERQREFITAGDHDIAELKRQIDIVDTCLAQVGLEGAQCCDSDSVKSAFEVMGNKIANAERLASILREVKFYLEHQSSESSIRFFQIKSAIHQVLADGAAP